MNNNYRKRAKQREDKKKKEKKSFSKQLIEILTIIGLITAIVDRVISWISR